MNTTIFDSPPLTPPPKTGEGDFGCGFAALGSSPSLGSSGMLAGYAASSPSNRIHNSRRRKLGTFRLRHEALESRQLLMADPIISEFVASNSHSLLDGNGHNPDWIEIFNAGDTDVNLNGWHLTDDPTDLNRWKFPEAQLGAGEYLVVFASGDDTPDSAGNLHTNFRLNSSGEYLALIQPDGVTVASEFGTDKSDYPPQFRDVSYGANFADTPLVTELSTVDVLVPDQDDDSRYGTSWRGGDEATFEAAGGLTGWRRGLTGAGQQPSEALVPYREAVSGEPSLLSYYTFDNDTLEADGIQDVAGSKTYHGSAVDNVEFGAGIGGKALSLNGDGYVDIGSISELSFRNRKATFEAWLRPMHASGPDDRSWLGTRNTRRPVKDRYSLHVSGDHSALSTSGQGSSSVGAELTPGEWSYVAVVFDLGNDGSPTTTYYVNGHQVGDVQPGGLDRSANVITTQIGSAAFPNAKTNFVGDIDELAIYTDALDAERILEHFTAVAFPTELEFVDVQDDMLDQSSSAYLRYPFWVDEPDPIRSLKLEMRFDDGFAAFVNGVPAASQNAPEQLNFQSTATTSEVANRQVSFNASAGAGALKAGENILSIHGLNVDKSDPGFFAFAQLSGTALFTDPLFYLEATPGGPNHNGLLGFAEAPTIEGASGYYSEPFEVLATSGTAGATLVYTTDGSAPTELNGRQVPASGPDRTPELRLTISETTVLRVAAIHRDLQPSRQIASRTFLFTSDIIQQPEMDRDVVGPDDHFDGAYAASIEDDLKSLPVLSFVMDDAHIFGPDGIYTNDWASGPQWERPVSVEYFDAHNDSHFQIDAGLRLFGAATRNHVKKPLRLYFRSQYGAPRLNFPLFSGSPVDSFDQLTVRPGAQDAWTTTQGPDGAGLAFGATYLRDEFSRQTQLAMGHLSPRGVYVHLFINGTYWGMHNLTERPNADFNASHLGGSEEDWDVLSTDTRVVEGNKEAWDRMLAIAEGGLAGDETYREIQQYLDIDNFIDATAVRIWAGDTDWMRSLHEPQTGQRNKNWYAARNRNDGRFVFYSWDVEFGLGHDFGDNRATDVNVTDVDIADSPARLYTQLQENADFRMRFADRLQKHFFHDGVLTPAANQARWNALMDQVRPAIVAESARWGDIKNPSVPFTPEEWETEASWVRDEFFPVRTDTVVEQFRAIGLYPDVAAPRYAIDGVPQHGGNVVVGNELTIIAAEEDTVYYTVDAGDPRLPGGGINPQARAYEAGDALFLSSDVVLNSRTLRDGRWSALSEAKFSIAVPAADAVSLRISEIHYHPSPPSPAETAAGHDNANEFEFIEVVNISGQTIDLSGVRFVRQSSGDQRVGIDFDFANSGVNKLAAGERVVVVENEDAFSFRYGDGALVAGAWTGGLSNAGEQLTLMAGSETIHQFAYDGEWYQETNGNGSSLQMADATQADPTNWAAKASWRPSASIGGTPGKPGTSGNFDADSTVDVDDIDLLFAQVQRNGNSPTYDLTNDGLVDEADVDELVLRILGTTYGDTNLDARIDALDFATMAGNFGRTTTTWHDGDFDGDGIISFADFVRLSNGYDSVDDRTA